MAQNAMTTTSASPSIAKYTRTTMWSWVTGAHVKRGNEAEHVTEAVTLEGRSFRPRFCQHAAFLSRVFINRLNKRVFITKVSISMYLTGFIEKTYLTTLNTWRNVRPLLRSIAVWFQKLIAYISCIHQLKPLRRKCRGKNNNTIAKRCQVWLWSPWCFICGRD